jgi:hypothetical protein
MLLLLGFVAIAIMRWRSGVNLLVVRDYRKNRKFDKPVLLKMVIDSKSGSMKQGILYRSWMSIWEADTRVWELPDLASLKYGNIVYAVRGASGDINDDNLYFVPLPDVGNIGAMDYAGRLSGEIASSLANIAAMKPDEFRLKMKNKSTMSEMLKEVFNEKWVLNKMGVQPIGKPASLPRQYKSFLINRLEKEKSFGAARQDLLSKLLQYLPIIAVGICVFLVGLGDYQVAQGNAIMQQSNAAYLAASYTYLNAQNYNVARALAASGIYGYNATIQSPPAPPNYTGLQIPVIPGH